MKYRCSGTETVLGICLISRMPIPLTGSAVSSWTAMTRNDRLGAEGGASEIPEIPTREEVRDTGEPTHEDANLILRLAEMYTAGNVGEAASFTRSEKFPKTYGTFVKKYPPGSPEYQKLMGYLGWFETVGTLYKHHLLNHELLFDWITVEANWERVKGFATGMRKDAKNPALWENFELLAKSQPKPK